MSDEATTQGSASQDATGSSKRLLILLAVLAVGLGGLAYDRAVARPAVDAAYDLVAERAIEVNASSTDTLSNLDVQELIGKQPSETLNDTNGDLVEKYSWRAGLPIKTHDLFIVYRENNGKFLFRRAAKYAFESSGEVSEREIAVIAGTEGDDGQTPGGAAYDAVSGGGPGGDVAQGDSGGPGGPGGGAGPGRFDPEAMFAERDADGDGLLRGDELSDRMKENLEATDTDGDGAVSKEELTARIETMRAQRGPGGGGGPSSDPPASDARPRRPELESEEETPAETPDGEE